MFSRANPVSLISLILFRKYVLSLHRVENDRSTVTVVIGNVAKIVKRL
jgi:hypothetical protein